MKKGNLKLKRSFTLIELLVIIAIIGLLASIVLVSLRGAGERAKLARTLQFSGSVHHTLGADAAGIWDFDEGTGATTFIDSSGNGNNGSCSSDSCPTAGVSDTPIKKGYALNFDGSNDYINCGSASSVDAMRDYTYSLWVKPDTVSLSYQTLIGKGDLWRTGFFVTGSSIRGTTPYSVTSPNSQSVSGAVSVGKWAHIVLTHSATDKKIRLYANGQEVSYVSQIVGSGTMYDYLADNLVISHGTYYPYDGLIDEVRVYRATLTSAQIQKLYAEGLEKHQNLTMK